MADPVAQEKTCSHCGEVFPSKGKYDYHYRRIHQSEMKIRKQDDDSSQIVRSTNDKFICLCGKGYPVPQSLSRHQLTCLEWKDKQMTDENSEQAVLGISLPYKDFNE